MFTGLIEAVGSVGEIIRVDAGARIQVRAPLAAALSQGDSIAINGVCLTVVKRTSDAFEAEIGPETQRVTALGQLVRGALVNLERPLRADARLGGHFVQGHVDATGRIGGIRPDADFWWVAIDYPAVLRPYIIPKGSIAVDGISLTIARMSDEHFDVQIVPYTWVNTNLRGRTIGDVVNLECDVIGKYIARSIELMGGLDATVRKRVH